jgi:septal ring factor EnvC (AmiA/AmiB activator)
MNWTPVDVINSVAAITGVLLAVIAWWKGGAEKEKIEAETALLYANLSAEGAKREKQLKADMLVLENNVRSQNDKISELKEIIEQKDKRILELESLTEKQEKELQKLRSELNTLQRNIK